MDAVIKVGGSLVEDFPALAILCQELGLLAKAHRILIVPGGGEFADIVRIYHRRFSLSDVIAHKMAILGMDQFGLFLSDLTPNSQVTYMLDEAENLSSAKVLPIFLSSILLFQNNKLEFSWDVTSDSIAAYIADLLHSKKLILITSVDGIFTKDPKKEVDAKIIERITIRDLLNRSERTSVDKFLPKILLKTRLDCYVVNGKHPERIKAILNNEKTLCTQIV